MYTKNQYNLDLDHTSEGDNSKRKRDGGELEGATSCRSWPCGVRRGIKVGQEGGWHDTVDVH